ncbi:MAG TPA: hypothetical protein VHF58_06760 [Solirubrobacterales bacterium]|nr:hypothetical protein [Solirubrobacterales bacterium]
MMRRVMIAAAAISVGVLLPTTASAAVTCQVSGSTLEIDAGVSGDGNEFVMVTREAVGDADIVVSTTGSLPADVACTGSPTVTSIDLVDFDETAAAQATTLFVDLRRGAIAPGLTDEGDGSSEIEFDVDMITPGTDRFSVADLASLSAHNIRFGEDPLSADAGANLNGEEATPDRDVLTTGVSNFYAEGDDGDDTLTANGTSVGSGFTDPVSFDVTLTGNADDDTIIGGNGTNSLSGGDGDDDITGGPNSDNIQIGAGDDVADGGGSNADFASYLNQPTPVTVDLREQGGPQDTVGAGTDTLTNFESVLGGNQSDVLIGDDGPNTLTGGQLGNDAGNDVLSGLGGPDLLSGAPGDDVLDPGDGNDSVIGAAGNDTLTYETATAPVTVSLDASLTGTVQNTGGSGNDTLSDDAVTAGTDHLIENLIGSRLAGDVLTGSAATNVIRAYDGFSDTVVCGDGNGDLAILDDVEVDAPDATCETSDNAPRTSIVAGPADGSTTTDTTPTYDLEADTPATFELSVDDGPFAACADPCTTPALSLGTHTLAFRAVDTDGNENPELTPVQRTLTVTAPVAPRADTDPPETTAKGPKAKIAKARARITFSADEAGARFECKLDRRAYKPCTSPLRKKVKVGKHKLRVRATDAAGNTDPTPAVVRWRRIERR